MVNSEFGEIVHNWAEFSSSNTCTSIIEEIGSITRLVARRIPDLHFKRSWLDLFISQNYCHVNIDLSMLINLSFEPLISMHYRLSNVDLKFHVQMLIASIFLVCVELALAMHISVIYDERSTWWCTQFGLLVKMFLSIWSLFMSRGRRWYCYVWPRF